MSNQSCPITITFREMIFDPQAELRFGEDRSLFIPSLRPLPVGSRMLISPMADASFCAEATVTKVVERRSNLSKSIPLTPGVYVTINKKARKYFREMAQKPSAAFVSKEIYEIEAAYYNGEND